VQLLPASTDRLFAKKVDVVIRIFGHLKALGLNVCLVIANQWASGKVQRESLEKYEKIAIDHRLLLGEEMVFTSSLSKKWETGITRRMVREIFQCSNLFIFPTDHESFGLVVPEAALAGVLMVLNKSLDMQREIGGGNALYFDFGSYNRKYTVPDADRYYREIALIIAGRMKENESIRAKTFARQAYNFDTLYRHEYAPVLAESRLWG
jgi:glycosyltransferase involved in cell wall biosynthesis